ncbi:hypothetical protein [Dickeya oryzae]
MSWLASARVFNGHLYVSGVRHHIQDGQWLTHIDFGMPPGWSAEHRDLTPPPAAGLLPGVDGLQIGIVKKARRRPTTAASRSGIATGDAGGKRRPVGAAGQLLRLIRHRGAVYAGGG